MLVSFFGRPLLAGSSHRWWRVSALPRKQPPS